MKNFPSSPSSSEKKDQSNVDSGGFSPVADLRVEEPPAPPPPAGDEALLPARAQGRLPG